MLRGEKKGRRGNNIEPFRIFRIVRIIEREAMRWMKGNGVSCSVFKLSGSLRLGLKFRVMLKKEVAGGLTK